MHNPSIKIYSFYYKTRYVITKDLIYHPVLAGKSDFTNSCTFIGDDTGINISSKNKQLDGNNKGTRL